MSTALDTDVPGIGHNHPIDAILAPLIARQSELLEGVARFYKLHPTITDDETQGQTADFVRQIRATSKRIEEERKVAKQPILDEGRAIDARFSAVRDPLEDAVRGLEATMTMYARAKERQAREAARQEAERRAAEAVEAERLAAENRGTYEDAIAKAEAAETAARAVDAKPAELTRTRGDYGAVASLKQTWGYEVTDITKVPAVYLTVNDAMVKAVLSSNPAIKKDGAQPISGIAFSASSKVSVR